MAAASRAAVDWHAGRLKRLALKLDEAKATVSRLESDLRKGQALSDAAKVTFEYEVLALGVFDGQTLGIATSTNTWASFYNLGLLEELDLEPFAGGTWDEYNTWVAEATAAGADAGVFGGSDWTVGFRNFELQLRAEGGNLFRETIASGAPVAGVAGEEGYGTINQGYLEDSNVDPVKEISELISAQRAYEINSKMISSVDQMLQNANQTL